MKKFISTFLHQAVGKNRSGKNPSVIARTRNQQGIYDMSMIRIAALAVAFIFVAVLPSQSASATIPEASEQFSCANVSEIPQLECEALVAIYNQNGGPNWLNNSGWLETSTPCSWYGVRCDAGTVVALSLIDEDFEIFGLTGALPGEIGNLSNLIEIYLSDNELDSLPAEIGNLGSLKFFDLFGNNVSTLPAEIGTLTNLQNLNLHANGLSALPVEIGTLTNLDFLDLGGNQLRTLPEGIGNLTNLQTLYLGYNQLNTLPSTIVNLTQLEELDLDSNQLQVNDEGLLAWMNANDSDWADSQTEPPVVDTRYRIYLPTIIR